MSGTAPAPARAGAGAEEGYFFTSGQACCSTVGNASAAGIVFTIS
jgi:hypothetical protein